MQNQVDKASPDVSRGVKRCATTSSSNSSTIRVVVGEVNRSVKREDCREVLLWGLLLGALVLMGGTGLTKGCSSMGMLYMSEPGSHDEATQKSSPQPMSRHLKVKWAG